ncbi:MAG: cupredoxin domain-containing protein [Candidatus Paceibacterota bacterium]
MNIDQTIVTIVSLLGIGFTYWFFLAKKDNKVKVSGSVDIIVDGGYSPEVISIPKGKTTQITFLRKDPTACLEEVILGDFKIKRQLPLNKRVTIDISPTKIGEFTYSCSMGMYHGKIIVE